MNPAKVRDEDYIQFLIATPKVCSATEAARVQPDTVYRLGVACFPASGMALLPNRPLLVWGQTRYRPSGYPCLFG